MTERVGQQLGNYRLLRVIGQGGFADVYLGEHIHLKSLAAIKVLYTRLTGDLRENFLHEARMLAQLSHPHIVRILDFGIEEGIPYLIMEYAPHGTVRQRYPNHSKLPLPIVVEYVKQIADGLQYAHGQKLIHRDLKPDNILIGRRDELLISDFGVALIAQTTRSSQGAEDGFAGTASYMAPEQLRGQPQFACDQYALGIMIYEWLCGTRPFQGTVFELFSQHQSVPPTPLREHAPQLPPEVEQIVLRALEKDPNRRFPDVITFAAEFERASRSFQQVENGQSETQPAALEEQIDYTTSVFYTPLPTPSYPDLTTPLMGQSSGPESNHIRQRPSPRKVVPLVGLVLLLMLGTAFATSLYTTSITTSTSSTKPSAKTPTGAGPDSSVLTTSQRTSTQTSVATAHAIDGKNPTAYTVNGKTCAATLSNSTPKVVSWGEVTGTLYFQFSITCHAAWAKIVFDRSVAPGALGDAKIVRDGDGKAYTCDTGGNKAVAPDQTSCYTGMVYDGPDATASAYGWYRAPGGSASWSDRSGPY